MPTLIQIKTDVDSFIQVFKDDETQNGTLSDALEAAKLNLEVASAFMQRHIDSVNSDPLSIYDVELQ